MTEADINLTETFNPGTLMQRVSQSNPTFIAFKTGDPLPEQLRSAINVIPFIRDLRQIAMQRINESEVQP